MKRILIAALALAPMLVSCNANPDTDTHPAVSPKTSPPRDTPDQAGINLDYTPADLDALGKNPFDTLSNASLVPELDSVLIRCLLENPAATANDIHCFQVAADTAAIMISQRYKGLYQRLKEPERQLLKQSQDAWLVYYRKEQAFLAGAYVQGDAYGHGREHDLVVRYQWLFQLARQRYIALKIFNSQIEGPAE